MKKILITLLTFGFLFSGSSVFALTVSLYSVADQQTEIDAWITGLGGQVDILEGFESETPGWYQTLDTAVGNFSITDNTLAGTGSTSYTDSEDPFFQVRDYDANGRVNTTTDGSNYLDSADITELKLTLLDGLNLTNLFFYLSDPSDVKALTKTESATSSDAASEDVGYRQSNGSLWFVGISAEEVIESVVWSTLDSRDVDEYYTNDGFGLDDFSTVAPVPEPGTLVLLGVGLTGLAIWRRKRG